MGESIEKGKIIDKACEVIKKTYQQIDALKNDFERLLKDIDPGYQFYEEYSYGPKSLYLKEFHIYCYKKMKDEQNADFDENIVALIIIFTDSNVNNFKVIKNTAILGPEFWSVYLKTKNISDDTRAWHLLKCLTSEERKYYKNNKLDLDGQINEYHYKKNDNDEEWFGKFICHPITSIENSETIKTKIIDKLEITNDMNIKFV
jgi:hypothetical protein